MTINQFAVYQVREEAAYRPLRFRSYDELLQKGYRVDVSNYHQVYLSQLAPGDTAETICRRFADKLPRTFKGHTISVSDVIVLNRTGEICAYFVDKGRLIALAGFLRPNSSAGFLRPNSFGTLVSMDTSNYRIDGKPGTWLACDDVIVDGRHFFLMQNEQMKNAAACAVVDENGKLVVDAAQKFDKDILRQINEHLHPPQAVQQELAKKPPLETWQKAFENGEYLRAAEMTEEQSYSFIDGRINNLPPKKEKEGKRPSVLKRLHEKQAAIAVRSGKLAPQMGLEQEAERNRK